jgi:ATP phosphoribosyltransferase
LDEKKGVKTKIIEVSGSVEAACGLGLADAVVDLVETGTTMRVSGSKAKSMMFLLNFSTF